MMFENIVDDDTLGLSSKPVVLYSLAERSPVFAGNPAVEGLWDRIVKARSWAGLDRGDRVLIVGGVREAAAGQSNTYNHPDALPTYIEVQALDAAVDEDVLEDVFTPEGWAAVAAVDPTADPVGAIADDDEADAVFRDALGDDYTPPAGESKSLLSADGDWVGL